MKNQQTKRLFHSHVCGIWGESSIMWKEFPNLTSLPENTGGFTCSLTTIYWASYALPNFISKFSLFLPSSLPLSDCFFLPLLQSKLKTHMGLSHHFWKIPLLSVFALGRICSFISVFVGYTPCGHLWTEGCVRAGLLKWDSSLCVYCYTTVWKCGVS